MASKKWKNLVRGADGKTTREYNIWTGIKRRSTAGSSAQLKNAGYFGCSMEEAWQDFDVFCDWLFCKPFWNAKDQNGVLYEPDKDMFPSHPHSYCTESIVFVPNAINNFIITAELCSGSTYNKRLGKFVSQVSDSLSGTNKRHLGVFTTKEEAEEVYRIEKKSIARRMALFYYGKVEHKVTKYLLNYGGTLLNDKA